MVEIAQQSVMNDLISCLESQVDSDNRDEIISTLNNMDDILERTDKIRLGEIRNDRNKFCEYVLTDTVSKKHIIQSGIHKIIQYALGHYKKVLIELPRNHGKTTQILGGLLYELSHNKNILIKIISASDDLATKRIGAVKTHIESNSCYKKVFPEIQPYINKFNQKSNWGNTRITVNRDIIAPDPSVQGCIAGSSLVDLPCDRRKYFNGVPIKELIGKRDFLVYSYDHKQKKVVCAKAKKVWKSGHKKVYKISYEWWFSRNHKYEKRVNFIKATKEHLFLLRNGEYKRLDELKVNDSLMPFNKYISKRGGCTVVGLNNGMELSEARLVGECLGFGGLIFHHKDYNKLNNNSSNLQSVSNSEHAKIHKELLDNHKVISIEECGYEDVYDMSVEDTNNFAVNGIFAHNCGILSSGVGDRGDLVIFDDPCNLRNTVLFPQLRESVIQSYENVWTPLLSPQGRQWYIATPWHENDLTAMLKKRWKDDPEAYVLELHVGQKIRINNKGRILSIEETQDKFLPIWPYRWGRKALMARLRDVGSRSYDRGYRCRAIGEADILFKPEWLELALDHSAIFKGLNQDI